MTLNELRQLIRKEIKNITRTNIHEHKSSHHTPIRLTTLLREAVGEPIAIFLAGAPGAGKTTILRKVIPDLQRFVTLNVDDDFEDLLKKAGIGLDLKTLGATERSIAAKLQAVAKKSTDARYQSLMADRKDIIIDGTAAAVKPIEKKKAELEALGYRTIMIFIMASPMTSIERNIARGLAGGRALKSQIVFRSWQDVVANISIYNDMFDERFVLIFSDENPFRWDRQTMESELTKRLSDERPLEPEDIEKIQQSLDNAESFMTSADADLAKRIAMPVDKAKTVLSRHLK